MLNKFKNFAMVNLTLLLVLIASNSAGGPQSLFVMHEPDIPECLKAGK